MKHGNLFPFVAIAVAIIIGYCIVSHIRSQVAYVGIPCPVCGSEEVLDYGLDRHGLQTAHCYDCEHEFNYSTATIYDDPVCR